MSGGAGGQRAPLAHKGLRPGPDQAGPGCGESPPRRALPAAGPARGKAEKRRKRGRNNHFLEKGQSGETGPRGRAGVSVPPSGRAEQSRSSPPCPRPWRSFRRRPREPEQIAGQAWLCPERCPGVSARPEPGAGQWGGGGGADKGEAQEAAAPRWSWERSAPQLAAVLTRPEQPGPCRDLSPAPPSRAAPGARTAGAAPHPSSGCRERGAACPGYLSTC